MGCQQFMLQRYPLKVAHSKGAGTKRLQVMTMWVDDGSNIYFASLAGMM